jgi:hypothetical protein
VSVCVFLGPSLPLGVARDALDATFLPPAGHGDIYRATLRRPRPRAIGLIDGFFRHRPAVRHKEILWAMSAGIHVFGAASIGALRAAELADFGMVGVGGVFGDFAHGHLEDDDEVAVDHGPAELGFPPVNEAMVDIRATLAEALRQGVIGTPSHVGLIAIAKRTFYAERAYPPLLDAAVRDGLDPGEIAGLRAWLPLGRIGRKRDDALLLLARLREFLAPNPPPMKVGYRFEYTETWEADIAVAAIMPAESDERGELRRDQLLEELRLRPTEMRALRDTALGLALARREARRSRIEVSRQDAQSFRQRWLGGNDLATPVALDRWRRDNDLEGEAFEEFIAERARDDKLAAMARELIENCLVDALRIRGIYASFATRALAKRRALEAAGIEEASLAQCGVTVSELLDWFCRNRLGRAAPADADTLALELSFRDAAALYRALLREWLFARHGDADR